MSAKPEIEIVSALWVRNLIGCSAATLDRYLAADLLPPPFKLGRDRLWVKSELVAHIVKAAREAEND